MLFKFCSAFLNLAELPTSVVLHTSVPFGLQHVEKTIPEAEPILMEALKSSFPDLPKPKASKCHKWRYSQVLTSSSLFLLCVLPLQHNIYQVTKSYEDQPGVLELSQEPLLLVGGDAFTHSNFDGCVSSAEKIVQHLASKTAKL